MIPGGREPDESIPSSSKRANYRPGLVRNNMHGVEKW